MGSPRDQPGQKRKEPFRPGGVSVWAWLAALSLLLVISAVFVEPPHETRPANLPYSSFLEQVQAGNVTRVEMEGQQVRGRFKESISWSPDDTEATKHVAFVTTLPSVNDQRLLPLLEEEGVTVAARAATNSWNTVLLGVGGLLLIGLFYLASRQVKQTHSGISNFSKSRARQFSAGARPSVSFADVAGEEQAKLELAEIVDFLQYPAKYLRLGARMPRGVLLIGPPGTGNRAIPNSQKIASAGPRWSPLSSRSVSAPLEWQFPDAAGAPEKALFRELIMSLERPCTGKTLLARAVAGEAQAPFYAISASEFVELFVGVGAGRVRDLFGKAKENAPSIVFVDELDAVGRQRGTGLGNAHDEREQTLNQLLVEMDGFDNFNTVIVIAATNRPDVLDPALLRPGRFDRQVVVGLPDRRGREEILRLHSREIPLATGVELGLLARCTPGFSGADLANLCNEAALLAARQDKRQVAMADFQEALDRLLLGEERPTLLDERERRTVAYHEAGHTLVASLLPDATPVQRVTIIPRGQTLGVTAQIPEEERYNYSREELFIRLIVLMGGRAAEEIALNQMTSGAQNDFQQATRLAHAMVSRWGMSEALGPVGYHAGETHPFLGRESTVAREYSEVTAARIDQEVRKLLQEVHQEALRLLKENRGKLDRLATALLREETLDTSRIQAILSESQKQGQASDDGHRYDEQRALGPPHLVPG